jgi:hypothetical protein
MANPVISRDVSGGAGRAVCGARLIAAEELDERSSRFGRCREDESAGEPGSFFTLVADDMPVRKLRKKAVKAVDEKGSIDG